MVNICSYGRKQSWRPQRTETVERVDDCSGGSAPNKQGLSHAPPRRRPGQNMGTEQNDDVRCRVTAARLGCVCSCACHHVNRALAACAAGLCVLLCVPWASVFGRQAAEAYVYSTDTSSAHHMHACMQLIILAMHDAREAFRITPASALEALYLCL